MAAGVDGLAFVVIDGKVEEQDRSLPLELVWPDANEGLHSKLIDEETLPDFTSGDESTSHTAREAQSDNEQSQPRGPNGGEELEQSHETNKTPTETTKRLRRFISRSHNSLVSRPADYSKVESKVKQYIVNMKEQQEIRRQRGRTPPQQRKCLPLQSNCSAEEPSSFLEPTENVEDLKRQLADQVARVEVLQEDHDRLFLQNARLLNLIDEMRFKQYGRQSLPSQSHHRRPSSPGDLAIHQDNKNSIDSAISLRTNVERDSLLGYEAGSHSLTSTTGSFNEDPRNQFGRSYKAAKKSLDEVEAAYKRFVAGSTAMKCDKTSKSLLRQLREAATVAIAVRDQTRNLVQAIHKPKRQ